MSQYLRMTLSALAVAVVLVSSGCSGYRHSGEQTILPERNGDAHHTVRHGDTLAQIAKRNDIPLATLVAANNLAPPYLIYTDDVLRIPLGTTARRIWPSPQRPLKIMAKTKPIAESAANQLQQNIPIGPPVEGERYIVGPGESLSAIASKHRLSLADLVAVNGIARPYHLYPGQSLIIPPSEELLQRRAQVLSEIRGQQAINVPPPPPLNPDGFLWPVEGPVIRTFSQNSATGQSGAVNIAARLGTPVRATNNGIVAFAGEALDRYGRMIVLRHAGGYVSLYAHNGALLVEEGDTVYRGQVITEVGRSGDVANGQLRFELRNGMEPIDPSRIVVSQPGRMIGFL